MKVNTFLFWLYNLDLHNLDIEDLASCAPDPRTDYRWSKINIKEMDLTVIQDMLKNNAIENIEIDENYVDVMTEKLQSFHINNHESFVCPDCGAGYESRGYLDQHRHKKHGEGAKLFQCTDCKKVLSSKQRLEDHIRNIQRLCNVCNSEFENSSLLETHKKEHTTCPICNTDMKTKYKLERHIKIHLI
jgi:hypothetical protein